MTLMDAVACDAEADGVPLAIKGVEVRPGSDAV
jgi:hypothetical protein